MNLQYLDFDYSEDADGTGTFDAMASVSPAQTPALQAPAARMSLARALQQVPRLSEAAQELARTWT